MALQGQSRKENGDPVSLRGEIVFEEVTMDDRDDLQVTLLMDLVLDPSSLKLSFCVRKISDFILSAASGLSDWIWSGE